MPPAALEATTVPLPEPFYDHAGITIYHGDSRAIMPMLGEVDHVITDPPYSAQTHKGARTLANLDARPVDFDSITPQGLLLAFDEMGEHVKRWIVATVDWHHVHVLEAYCEGAPEPPLRFVRFGVWVKPDGAPQFTGDRPGTGWEAVAIMHSRREALRWNGGGTRGVWVHNIERGVAHPTAKPIGLVREWIEQFTDPDDLILDPYMGSGTVLRAAKDLGRRAIGIELTNEMGADGVDRRYCDLAAARLRQEVLL